MVERVPLTEGVDLGSEPVILDLEEARVMSLGSSELSVGVSRRSTDEHVVMMLLRLSGRWNLSEEETSIDIMTDPMSALRLGAQLIELGLEGVERHDELIAQRMEVE